jgi:hypothetical protein
MPAHQRKKNGESGEEAILLIKFNRMNPKLAFPGAREAKIPGAAAVSNEQTSNSG